MVDDTKYKFTTWLKKNKSAIKTIIAAAGTVGTDLLVSWNPVTPVMMSVKVGVGLVLTLAFRALVDYIDFKLPDFVAAEDNFTTM